jgi:hypothetical protein
MTDKIKLAAIKLKGIGSADRKWILKQLSARERFKLDPILSELDSIAFDQVLGLEVLDDTHESISSEMSDVAVPSPAKQDGAITSPALETHVVEALRKKLAQNSDVFLSTLVCGSTVESDSFLSQVLDRARHLRIMDLARKRSSHLPNRIVNNIRTQLIKSAESGVGNGRNI